MESLKDEFDRTNRQLEGLGKQIGWSTPHLHSVQDQFHSSLRDLFQQVLDSATQEKQNLIHAIAQIIDQLHQLGDQLAEDPRPYYVPHQSYSLLDQRQLLQEGLLRMQSLETQRSTQLAGKRTQLERLFWHQGREDASLDLTSSLPPLSTQVLLSYDEYIEQQQEAVEALRSSIRKQRERVAALARPLAETISPVSDETLPLYQVHQQLEKSIATLQHTTESHQQQWESFRSQMTTLWTAMEEDAEAQLSSWMEPYQSSPLASSVLRAAEEQVNSLQASLRDNLILLMDKHYQALEELWQHLAYSPEQMEEWRQAHPAACPSPVGQETRPTDQLQEGLQQLLASETELRALWDEVAPIFKAIRHREQFLQKREAMEEKARSDPNRWQARGGRLLQEEAERKRISKQIKLSESYLRKEITAWEQKHQQDFLHDGIRFLEALPKDDIASSFTKSTKSSTLKRCRSRSRPRPAAAPEPSTSSTAGSTVAPVVSSTTKRAATRKAPAAVTSQGTSKSAGGAASQRASKKLVKKTIPKSKEEPIPARTKEPKDPFASLASSTSLASSDTCPIVLFPTITPAQKAPVPSESSMTSDTAPILSSTHNTRKAAGEDSKKKKKPTPLTPFKYKTRPASPAPEKKKKNVLMPAGPATVTIPSFAPKGLKNKEDGDQKENKTPFTPNFSLSHISAPLNFSRLT